MTSPYRILEHLRSGRHPDPDDLRQAVVGATDGSWTDAQLAAFLMAVAVQGLGPSDAGILTEAMLASGERWELRDAVPHLGDKHSTGGVGDKTTLVLGPLLAACGVPLVMLTGRGLGHTAGTADKLDVVPGLDQQLDRARARRLVEEVGLALGMATDAIAPADKRLYALRDETGTVRSVPLVVASILSKKRASGAAGLVLDVKTGSGAFFRRREESVELARLLVATAAELDLPATALVTDMAQPLGAWVGHASEVRESLDVLEGAGEAGDDPGTVALRELVLRLAEELPPLLGVDVDRDDLEAALASGQAREAFDRWAMAQGAEPAWLEAPDLPLAPVETVLEAPRGGVVTAVETEDVGLLMVEAGGGRRNAGDSIDHGVSLRVHARLGDRVEAGQPLARLFLRREDPELAGRMAACWTVEPEEAVADPSAVAPPLVHERIAPARGR